MRLRELSSTLLSVLVTALLVLASSGCTSEPVDVDQAVQNAYAGKGIVIYETADYVYVERPLEALAQQEQVEAYQFALDTLTATLEDSDFAEVPGSGTVLDMMWDINMQATIDQIGADLDVYQEQVEEQLEVKAPSPNLVPSGVMGFVGLPISASALVGASGAITAMIVMKIYKVTRIDKSDGTIDDSWHLFTWDAEDAAILQLGVGVGAGGGLGLHGGLGLIWGELDHPGDFRGQAGLVSSVPLSGGLGPVFKAGVRWPNVTESAQPTNFFVMAGVEGGAQAKALETHVQAGNITGLWQWVSSALGFNNVTEGGGIDPETLE